LIGKVSVKSLGATGGRRGDQPTRAGADVEE
jgi:hypothetical protein